MSADGSGSEAKFNQPTLLAIAPSGGELYVADKNNKRIRKLELCATGNPRCLLCCAHVLQRVS